MRIQECEMCSKYTVSCRVLEGFGCCRCCGISECEDDTCPAELKLPTILTKYEFYIKQDLNGPMNAVNRMKQMLYEDNFTRREFIKLEYARGRLLEAKKEILEDKEIRKHIKQDIVKDINSRLSSYKDIDNLLVCKLLGGKKKGNLKYIKRNINKFTAENISKNLKLCRHEKVKLLKLKGVENPYTFM